MICVPIFILEPKCVWQSWKFSDRRYLGRVTQFQGRLLRQRGIGNFFFEGYLKLAICSWGKGWKPMNIWGNYFQANPCYTCCLFFHVWCFVWGCIASSWRFFYIWCWDWPSVMSSLIADRIWHDLTYFTTDNSNQGFIRPSWPLGCVQTWMYIHYSYMSIYRSVSKNWVPLNAMIYRNLSLSTLPSIEA